MASSFCGRFLCAADDSVDFNGTLRRRGARAPSRGFTLLELLVTCALIAIFAVIAAPSLATLLSHNRLYSSESDLLSSLALARTEATRRNVPVFVSAAAPVTGNEFGGGWSVWVDVNGDGTQQSDEPVLRLHEALPATVRVSSATRAIRYMPLGITDPPVTVTVTFCSEQARHRDVVTVQPNGLIDGAEVNADGCS